MDNLFNYLPGFRTNTTWKKVVAIFYYGICVAMIPYQGFLSFLVGLAFPFIFFFVKDRKKLKVSPTRNKINKIGIVFTVIWFGLMISMGSSMANTDKIASAKAIQVQKQQAIVTAKKVANDKVLAIAKAKSDKIIADKKAIADKKQAIIDKKIADAKAIQDKKDADAQAVIDAQQAQAKEDADAKAKAKQDAIDNASAEDTSALNSAETYGNTMNMSKDGIYDQLTSASGDKFTAESAQYAVDNVKVDYNANALASAQTYQKSMNMSPSAIYDQLISTSGDKFTAEQAQYARDNLK
ncbi:Ltp family lipoprotein [Clostridium psychrophilum]|uniref:Ltp family lipoprotein n=1 Tax=Clostridium psychrophilum TaxID=132926 RepID=UPI001FE26D49|nr:Ltp family lipoprotein [Clostridium psychrophilum]